MSTLQKTYCIDLNHKTDKGGPPPHLFPLFCDLNGQVTRHWYIYTIINDSDNATQLAARVITCSTRRFISQNNIFRHDQVISRAALGIHLRPFWWKRFPWDVYSRSMKRWTLFFFSLMLTFHLAEYVAKRNDGFNEQTFTQLSLKIRSV